jgi:hypothetical protein
MLSLARCPISLWLSGALLHLCMATTPLSDITGPIRLPVALLRRA